MGIFIIAVATDNDSGYNKEDNDTFLEYFHEFLEKGFDAAVQKISQFDKVYWISDFLHIIKLARKYLIKGNITIRSTTDKVFNSITLENLLKIGLPLNDKSDISFMKDFYPLKIFDITNALHLLKGENYDEFIYFLPYTLWIESLMNPTLTKSSRLFLIKTAFYILYYFYYQADHLTEGVSFYVIKDAECQFLNQTFVMHAMNSLIITYCLINTFDDLCLNRISSHPLENFFGQMRILCRDFDSFENFLRCSVKAYMNINLMNNFNYTPSIKKRINAAGVKITKDSGDLNFSELNCLSENAALCCFLLANMNVEDIYKIQPDLTSFDNFISLLYVIGARKTQCPIHLNRPKFSSGMSIKARCSCAYYENKLQQGFI